MKIIAYSDGSFEDNMAASVSFILTDYEFLGRVIKPYRVRTPYEAELLGVIQVLEFIEEKKYEYDKLIIYTDARAVASKFPLVKQTGTIPSYFKSRKKWSRILELTRGKNVFIYHQPAHMDDHNTNKTCDILARICRECLTMAS